MSNKHIFYHLHTVDNDPVFSLNVFTKAIVHVKFFLRLLSKPAPLCENILQHQGVARCPDPQSYSELNQTNKNHDDGRPTSFMQCTSGNQ